MMHKSFKDSDYHKKTYIVTGAAGFVGYYMARCLLDHGATVIGIDNINDYYDVALKQHRLSFLQDYKNFTFYKQDISDKKKILKIFQTHQADIIVHLAAQAGVRYSLQNPDAYVQSNLVGFMSILDAVRETRPEHFIYASSSSVYGKGLDTPYNIDQNTDHPVSLYAATKKSNELLAHSYADLYEIPMTGLRFFTVYGPMGRPDMAYFKFTQKILNNEPIEIYNYGDMKRDFTYIDDIISGIMGLVTKSSGLTGHNVFNIGHNRPEKLMDMIELLEGYLGKKAEKVLLPMQLGDVYTTYADIQPLNALTGFTPQTSLEDGLKSFIKWYKTYYSLR